VSKNTSETDIFPRGTKSLLTNVIYKVFQHKQVHSFVIMYFTAK